MLYATKFQYSGFEIEAATDDDGNYFISYATIEKILKIRPNSCREMVESKSLKQALGEGFELGKWSGKTNLSNAKKSFLTLSSFLAVIAAKAQPIELKNKTVPANPQALAFVIAGFTSDFTTTLKYHFGEVLDEEQKEYLRELVFARIQAFKAWTDIIHARYREFYGEKPPKWYYGKLVKKANMALFGVANFGSDRTKNMTEEQQETIKDFERFLARKAKNNPDWSPEAVLGIAIKHFTA